MRCELLQELQEAKSVQSLTEAPGPLGTIHVKKYSRTGRRRPAARLLSSLLSRVLPLRRAPPRGPAAALARARPHVHTAP
eukprot:SAG22_NODE_843_length_6889_cov_61.521649_1_plen_79_part_10